MPSSKDDIIKVASELFWKNSYNHIGVAEICKEAGIQKGSFYHYFKSKEDLALTMLDTMWAYHQKHFLLPSLNRGDTPINNLLHYVDTLVDMINTMQQNDGCCYGCPFGNFAAELSNQHPNIQNKLQHIFNEQIALFTKTLEEAIVLEQLDTNTSPKQLAEMLFSLVQGQILLVKSNHSSPENIRKNVRILLKAA